MLYYADTTIMRCKICIASFHTAAAVIAIICMAIQLDSASEEAYSINIKIPPGKVLIPFSRNIRLMHFGFSFKMMNLFSMKKQNGFVYRQPKKQRRFSAVSLKYYQSALWMEPLVLRHLFLPDLSPMNLVLRKSGRFIVVFRPHNMSLPCAPIT